MWDFTLIMVILFMTSQIMKVSIKKLNELNTMLILQLQVPSKEHHRVNYITNYVLNLLNLVVGLRNYVLFIKSKQLEYQNTCLVLFLKPIIYIQYLFIRCCKILQQNWSIWVFFLSIYNIKMEQTMCKYTAI